MQGIQGQDIPQGMVEGAIELGRSLQEMGVIRAGEAMLVRYAVEALGYAYPVNGVRLRRIVEEAIRKDPKK